MVDEMHTDVSRFSRQRQRPKQGRSKMDPGLRRDDEFGDLAGMTARKMDSRFRGNDDLLEPRRNRRSGGFRQNKQARRHSPQPQGDTPNPPTRSKPNRESQKTHNISDNRELISPAASATDGPRAQCAPDKEIHRMNDSFATRDILELDGTRYQIRSLAKLGRRFDLKRLPYSMKILLENLLRHEDGANITAK